jgi:hypothetical protein
MHFYNLLEDNLKIRIEYEAEKNELCFLLDFQIPNSIDFYSQKVEYYNKTIFSIWIDKLGGYSEKLMVEFDLESLLDDYYFYGTYPSQSEIINRHPLLAFYKKQMLKLLIKHPFCNDLGLVKYDCSSIEDISFFIAHPHLKGYGLIAWQELFLLPDDKPLTTKQAFDYLLNYRKEKSLQKAVFQDYKEQISTTKEYIFHYIYAVCKYISDVNIATRMVVLKFEEEFLGNRSYMGTEKLFAYLAQTYTQKQIELLINDFSKNNVYLFFDTLEMFSQFEDGMLQEIEKVKPKCYEFHDAVVRYHRIAVAQKLLHTSFEYSIQQKRGCVKKEPYSVQLPQNGRELYEWSQTLQNCLSGYAKRIKNRDTTVYGFFKDDVLQIAVEINSNQIVQANSKYNQQPSSEDTELINAWFDENLNELFKLTNSSFNDTIVQLSSSEA